MPRVQVIFAGVGQVLQIRFIPPDTATIRRQSARDKMSVSPIRRMCIDHYGSSRFSLRNTRYARFERPHQLDMRRECAWYRNSTHAKTGRHRRQWFARRGGAGPGRPALRNLNVHRGVSDPGGELHETSRKSGLPCLRSIQGRRSVTHPGMETGATDSASARRVP